MKLSDIANIRLLNQRIASSEFKSVREVVDWMGAMQAQDYAMAKWAIGIRLPNSTDDQIESTFNKGEILRTHVMRPTWHFVTSDDIHWMLELTAPHIKSSLKSRHKELELDEKIIKKSNRLIEKTLIPNKHLTREELMLEFTKAKIPTDNNRNSHFLFLAELEGLICSGISKGKKQTYALLDERVKKRKILNEDEALAKLAKKYFTSHGPATIQDFIWWSGLSVAKARHALEMIKKEFVSETIGSQTYWLSNSVTIPEKSKDSVFLLPAFDEFIISYKDRSACVDLESYKKAVSENGIFRPVIVINGQVSGIWKRSVKANKLIVELDFFKPHSKATIKLIEKSAEAFASFLNKSLELNYNQI